MIQTWQPTLRERNYWKEKIDPYEVKYLWIIYYEDLVHKVESLLKPLYHSEFLDEFDDAVVATIVRLFRKFSGRSLGGETGRDDNLSPLTGRVGRHLRDLRQFICRDQSVKEYVTSVSRLEEAEDQVVGMFLLLMCNDELEALRYSRRRGRLELAVLMVRTGLDKFLDCPQKS